jgi:hypothetical protein
MAAAAALPFFEVYNEVVVVDLRTIRLTGVNAETDDPAKRAKREIEIFIVNFSNIKR